MAVSEGNNGLSADTSDRKHKSLFGIQAPVRPSRNPSWVFLTQLFFFWSFSEIKGAPVWRGVKSTPENLLLPAANIMVKKCFFHLISRYNVRKYHWQPWREHSRTGHLLPAPVNINIQYIEIIISHCGRVGCELQQKEGTPCHLYSGQLSALIGDPWATCGPEVTPEWNQRKTYPKPSDIPTKILTVVKSVNARLCKAWQHSIVIT